MNVWIRNDVWTRRLYDAQDILQDEGEDIRAYTELRGLNMLVYGV